MKNIQASVIIFILTLILISCQSGELRRNKIAFKDKYELVEDSLIQMQYLLEKLPKTYRINYFVDARGYLYVNNTKLGLLKNSINSSRIRNDMSFKKFSDKEFKSFFSLRAFLAKNYLDASYFDPTIQEFVFDYRRTKDEGYDDLRVIVINSDKLFDEEIKNNYQILDQQGKLKLLAPYDVKLK